MKTSKLVKKVITWRLVSVTSMLATMWVLTGDLVTSTSVTLVVQIVQTAVHALFESLWEKHEKSSVQ